MSTAKVITIVHPSSAVNNIVNDASGNVAVGNNLTVAGTSSFTGTLGNITTGTISSGNITSSGTVAATTGTLYPIVSGTAQASTSGTSIDFTSIPSWVKRITVMFNGVSLSGSSYILIQGITAGGAISTGYSSNGNLLPSSTPSGTSHYSTAGFSTFFDGATVVASGSLILSLLGSNVWTIQGVLARTDTAGYLITSTGVGSLGAQLTGVRITTANGTDTFDAGSINIMYE